ncbi:Proteinase inhibitor I78 [Ascosphaera apis ARSEF 7405]|uniref:Proteinase inhibitor I78 n=1 Tax=Ascosphaera apis ARSEF 7405 TaxID=392613 RepID=A0A162IRL8_9EURO|nr:Proteinase inhibitor I78 [Ascosphaera apis ARSEF 7405]
MPLVIPQTDDPKVDWRLRLLGKKLTESEGEASTFSVKDLPDCHRIILPGMFTTMDNNPDRLTIIVDENNIVTDVNYS